MKKFRSLKKWSIVLSILMCMLGFFMIVDPNCSLGIIGIIMGIICICTGVYEITRYFNIGFIGILFRYDLFKGILNILIGTILLTEPFEIMLIVPVILGIYIISVCAFSIQFSFEMRYLTDKNWWIFLLLGVVGIILGFIVVLDPFSSMTILTIFIGVSLLFVGIENICTIHKISKSVDNGEHDRVIEAIYTENDD